MFDLLAPLLAPVSDLRGVGPAIADKLARLAGGPRVADLLFHIPDSFVDRRTAASIRDTVPGQVVTWTVQVAGHEPPLKPNHPHRVRVTDGTAFAELAIWEKQRLATLTRAHSGEPFVLNGRVDAFGSRLSMKDPAYAVTPEDIALIPPVDPGVADDRAPIRPRVARRDARRRRPRARPAGMARPGPASP